MPPLRSGRARVDRERAFRAPRRSPGRRRPRSHAPRGGRVGPLPRPQRLDQVRRLGQRVAVPARLVDAPKPSKSGSMSAWRSARAGAIFAQSCDELGTRAGASSTAPSPRGERTRPARSRSAPAGRVRRPTTSPEPPWAQYSWWRSAGCGDVSRGRQPSSRREPYPRRPMSRGAALSPLRPARPDLVEHLGGDQDRARGRARAARRRRAVRARRRAAARLRRARGGGR